MFELIKKSIYNKQIIKEILRIEFCATKHVSWDQIYNLPHIHLELAKLLIHFYRL